MQTLVLVVKEEGLESRQVFEDDVSGAVREYQYWRSQGKQVLLEQFLETSDEVQ